MSKKLLFIGSTRLGDAVLSTGLLAAALERYAPDEVTVACGPVAAPVFSAVPKLKEIILLDKKEKGHWLKLWRRVVRTRWDVVIDLRNSVISYLIASRETRRFIMPDPAKHKAEQLAAVLKLPKPPENRVWLNRAAEAFADAHLPEGVPFLALCPTANWGPKQWPAERFAEAARKLPFTCVAVFGAGGAERAQAQPVLEALKETHQVIDLVGKTSPLEAAACLGRAGLVLANDSGLMHIAAAMGAPTLGLFGPSNDVEYRPWGPSAAFVRGAPFHGLDKTPDPQALMQAVSVEKVVEAAGKLLKSDAFIYAPLI